MAMVGSNDHDGCFGPDRTAASSTDVRMTLILGAPYADIVDVKRLRQNGPGIRSLEGSIDCRAQDEIHRRWRDVIRCGAMRYPIYLPFDKLRCPDERVGVVVRREVWPIHLAPMLTGAPVKEEVRGGRLAAPRLDEVYLIG